MGSQKQKAILQAKWGVIFIKKAKCQEGILKTRVNMCGVPHPT